MVLDHSCDIATLWRPHITHFSHLIRELCRFGPLKSQSSLWFHWSQSFWLLGAVISHLFISCALTYTFLKASTGFSLVSVFIYRHQIQLQIWWLRNYLLESIHTSNPTLPSVTPTWSSLFVWELASTRRKSLFSFPRQQTAARLTSSLCFVVNFLFLLWAEIISHQSAHSDDRGNVWKWLQWEEGIWSLLLVHEALRSRKNIISLGFKGCVSYDEQQNLLSHALLILGCKQKHGNHIKCTSVFVF